MIVIILFLNEAIQFNLRLYLNFNLLSFLVVIGLFVHIMEVLFFPYGCSFLFSFVPKFSLLVSFMVLFDEKLFLVRCVEPIFLAIHLELFENVLGPFMPLLYSLEIFLFGLLAQERPLFDHVGHVVKLLE